LTFVAPYFLASALRLPGHGFYGTSGHPEGSLRKLKQAFVSTILKQLAKPPFLPQLCSISSRTCNNPHHDAPPDRNQVVGYRRGLASLSVVKELLFRVHRNVPVDRFTIALSKLTGLRSRQKNWLGTCLAGLTCSLCANSPSSSSSGSSNFQPRSSNLQKIKNPASSAGHSHRSSGFARSSTNCYPVLVRRLTIGLFLVYFRPTVNSPDRSDEYCTPRTINEYTGFSWFVKPP